MDVQISGTPVPNGGSAKSEGIKQYYAGKIEELQVSSPLFADG